MGEQGRRLDTSRIPQAKQKQFFRQIAERMDSMTKKIEVLEKEVKSLKKKVSPPKKTGLLSRIKPGKSGK